MKVGAFIEGQGLDGRDDIAGILAHDVEQQTGYLVTLRSYLATSGSTSAMAAGLHIHNNTVRYRLARLGTDSCIDLTDPQTRLWLWLRITTMDLAPKATAGLVPVIH